MSIVGLPTELKQEIVLYLPVDHKLTNVAQTCHSIRDVMCTIMFASTHLLRAIRQKNSLFEWQIITKLPFAYASAALVHYNDSPENLIGIQTPPNFLAKLTAALLHLGHTTYWSNHTTSLLSILAAAHASSAALDLLSVCGNHDNILSNLLLHGIPVSHLAKVAPPKYSQFSNIYFTYSLARNVFNNSDPAAALRFASFLVASNLSASHFHDLFKMASRYGQTNVVRIFLTDKRCNPAEDYDFAIREASARGHTEIVKLLLADSRVNPTVNDNTAIKYASGNGQVGVVKLLLTDPRVNPAANDNEAFKKASYMGHSEVVKLLLADNRVNPAASNNYAIRCASSLGCEKVVKYLLSDARINPVVNNNEAFRFASSNGHAAVVNLLLTDGRVNPAVKYDEPIISASLKGHVEVVKLLLADSRVDPAVEDNCAIQFAASVCHTEVVKILLIDSRVDPTANNNFVFEQASFHGDTEIVKLLPADSRLGIGVKIKYVLSKISLFKWWK
ncbi:hypothetical protein HK100_004327 [Physocladia obscura]|uniref:Uncharacterized protein n=1 Tax=Physocladia obscura TaxID=109957 RepID=A0AAD5ST81_9FUNG|nr:hypothetical protein HK100_004327 [Physocladia obscura]